VDAALSEDREEGVEDGKDTEGNANISYYIS
jgi:hypothetical protein